MADRAGIDPLLALGLALVVLSGDDDVNTSLKKTVLRWPVVVDGKEGRGGSRITQEYKPPRHMGVDIAVPGHYKDVFASVLAVADGRVARAMKAQRGWSVLLDHGDYASGYLHMTQLDVKTGDRVVAGQRLGTMGADPLDGQGVVHLHFQLAPLGHTVDPEPYLKGAV